MHIVKVCTLCKNSPVPQQGLRETKKQRTAAAIEAAAVNLADENGFDTVTVEQIAERADVTSRTFFNYFRNKDDAFLGVHREREPLPEVDPADYPGVDTLGILTSVFRQKVSALDREGDAEMHGINKKRHAVLAQHPELLQREFEKMASLERDLSSFVVDIMRRQGHTEAEITRDAYSILAIMGAFFHQAFRAWGEDLGGEPLAVHFDRAVENTTRILRDRETA
jgi:AcrR family transcriptional regulator